MSSLTAANSLPLRVRVESLVMEQSPATTVTRVPDNVIECVETRLDDCAELIRRFYPHRADAILALQVIFLHHLSAGVLENYPEDAPCPFCGLGPTEV